MPRFPRFSSTRTEQTTSRMQHLPKILPHVTVALVPVLNVSKQSHGRRVFRFNTKGEIKTTLFGILESESLVLASFYASYNSVGVSSNGRLF
jgi:hypothetical protein